MSAARVVSSSVEITRPPPSTTRRDVWRSSGGTQGAVALRYEQDLPVRVHYAFFATPIPGRYCKHVVIHKTTGTDLEGEGRGVTRVTSHPLPWRGSLFHVIIMRVTQVISMSFCAPTRGAKSWRRHCTKKLRYTEQHSYFILK